VVGAENKPGTVSAPDYRHQLAYELLVGLEADTLGARPLLMKARRLANALEDRETEQWLSYELAGYPPEVGAELDERVDRVGRRYRLPPGDSPEERMGSIQETFTGRPTFVRLGLRRESLPRIEDEILPGSYQYLKAYPAQAAVAARLAQAKCGKR
jgi:hypothetical protein